MNNRFFKLSGKRTNVYLDMKIFIVFRQKYVFIYSYYVGIYKIYTFDYSFSLSGRSKNKWKYEEIIKIQPLLEIIEGDKTIMH